jgi:hypothetical protein
VTQLLAVSPVWKDYEQQKHDLFLDTEKPLALTQVTLKATNYISPNSISELDGGLPDDGQDCPAEHAAAYRGQPGQW